MVKWEDNVGNMNRWSELRWFWRDDVAEEVGVQLEEVLLLAVDAALLQLDQEVLPALLPQNYPAQRVHQLLVLPLRAPPLNHDRNRPLDHLPVFSHPQLRTRRAASALREHHWSL